MLPKLEKKHEISPSSRDEALSHCSVLREIPRSLLKFETVHDTLDVTQKIHRHTWSDSRGTLSFQAQLNLSRFSSPDLNMRVDSSALSGKGSPPSRCTSGGGWSHTEPREEPSWVWPHSEKHQLPHPLKVSPMPGHLFESNLKDEVKTRRGTDTPLASSRKSHRFQIQLDKWPDTP